jgi:hypothetical protein
MLVLGQIWLTYMKKAEVFNEMHKDFTARDFIQLENVKIKYFYKLWKTEFRHVFVRKHSSVGHCETCVTYKARIEACKTHHDRIILRALKSKHIQEVRRERRCYHGIREAAVVNPELHLSLIIDGMDQNKTTLPRFKRATNSDEGRERLKVHVTGVLCHGQKTKAYVFTSFPDVASDSNLTIQCLMAVFADIGFENLPRNLYIQMDNTSRENKNYFILRFFAFLVDQGIFEKVQISFLPVGHTHEDVDQMFGCFSRALKLTTVTSLEKLHSVLEGAFSPTPKIFHLTAIGNYRDWIDDPIYQSGDWKLTGIDLPHAFVMTLVDSKVALRYKLWQAHEVWLPAVPLKVLSYIPTTIPRVLSNRIIDVAGIRQTLNISTQRIPQDQMQQLTNTLDSIETRQQLMCRTCKELRKEEIPLKTHKDESKEVTNRKNRERKELYRNLSVHQDSGTCNDYVQISGWPDVFDSSERKVHDVIEEVTEEEPDKDYSVLWEAAEVSETPALFNGPRPRKSVQRAPKEDDFIIVLGESLPFYLAQIIEITHNDFTVHWWGTDDVYKKWMPCWLQGANGQNSNEPHTERQERTVTILDWGFKLLKSPKTNRLPVSVLKNIHRDQRCEWTYVPS